MITINIFLIIAQLETYSGCSEVLNYASKLQPNINSEQRIALCSLKKLNRDLSKVIVAMAFKESSIRTHKVNIASRDYGILQINEKNVQPLRLNVHRLLTDSQYSLNSGLKVFNYFLKRYGLREAIARYNCGTRKACVKSKVVIKYFKDVESLLSLVGGLNAL